MTHVKLTLSYIRDDGATATVETFAKEKFAGRTEANWLLWEPVEYLEPALIQKGYERDGWSVGPSEDPGITQARVSEKLPE